MVGIRTLCVIGKERERGRREREKRARWRRNWRRTRDKNGPGKRLNERERRKEDGQGQARMPSSSWVGLDWIGLDCFPSRSKAKGACTYIQYSLYACTASTRMARTWDLETSAVSRAVSELSTGTDTVQAQVQVQVRTELQQPCLAAWRMRAIKRP